MNEFLFLDIDDVLNSEDYHERNPWIRDGGYDPDNHPRAWIDPKAVERVNRILDETETDPEIILSSTWRHTFGPEKITEILDDRGFDHQVTGKTPGHPRRNHAGYARPTRSVPDRDRGDHIENFLKFKRSVDSVETILILDNLPLEELEPFEDHVVQTEPEYGLQDEHVEKALGVLEKTPTIDLSIGQTTKGGPSPS